MAVQVAEQEGLEFGRLAARVVAEAHQRRQRAGCFVGMTVSRLRK